MKKTLLVHFYGRRLRCLVASAAILISHPPVSAVTLGDSAPDFKLESRLGELQLSRYKGHLVYLDFWATWCAPCRQSLPWMHDMQSRYGAKGLRIVAVNLDVNRAEAMQFLRSIPMSFDVAFDPVGDVPKNYRIKAMPTSLLIGPDGRVIAIHKGFRLEDTAEIEAQIAQYLQQMPVNFRATK
ncbi:TlpA family protein disulfide reductase [Roseateles amylovorans]|uniref:TlpA family protein disulfide reductase n=1 Tax=Roseateles amylovorans TaxID=2978473 RepID=A0ABY6B5Z8_9BURK|nr:TlpA disulfide reductase family protein [Roseateles amylovorans]UXH80329.1 TlpA family protein disulfide reductase [Roseateles amylovorans]